MTSYAIVLPLSVAQVGALECREGGGFDADSVIEPAWTKGRQGHRSSLSIPKTRADRALSELIELANSEDADAEAKRKAGDKEGARKSVGAALAFSHVADNLAQAMNGDGL